MKAYQFPIIFLIVLTFMNFLPYFINESFAAFAAEEMFTEIAISFPMQIIQGSNNNEEIVLIFSHYFSNFQIS